MELPTKVTELMAIATAANVGNHPNISAPSNGTKASGKSLDNGGIYPVTLPSSVYTSADLNTMNITVTKDRADAIEHLSLLIRYQQIIQDFTRQCINSAKLKDISVLTSCISLTAPLNLHLREFNQNANSEFEKILGKPQTLGYPNSSNHNMLIIVSLNALS